MTVHELDKAIGIVERLRSIASNEMLMQGSYLEKEVSRPDLAASGSPCGGRRACMVGSFFLAAKVPFNEISFWTSRRDEIAEQRTGMALARETLNEVSFAHPDFPYPEDEQVVQDNYTDPMEDLFEAADKDVDLHAMMLEVVDKALGRLHNMKNELVR
jgi:hypothetical protein